MSDITNVIYDSEDDSYLVTFANGVISTVPNDVNNRHHAAVQQWMDENAPDNS